VTEKNTATPGDLRFGAKLLDGREETTRRVRSEVAANLEALAAQLERPLPQRIEEAIRRYGQESYRVGVARYDTPRWSADLTNRAEDDRAAARKHLTALINEGRKE